MSQIKALYRLQKIDLDLDAQRRRVREINAVLEQDGGLGDLRAEVAALQDALHEQEARSADLNLEIKSIASQTAQLNDRMYGGHVSNPKELQDMEGKIAELKRRRADRENALLESMIAIDELRRARRRLRAPRPARINPRGGSRHAHRRKRQPQAHDQKAENEARGG